MKNLKKCSAFTLAEVFFHPDEQSKRIAFTLAEVLITLGIIGVVAALTMPSLISYYKKQEVETKLKRFYTNINQAVKLSEVENGPVEYWTIGEDLWEDDNYKDDNVKEFYNKYLAKYLRTISSGSMHFVLTNPDGSEGFYERDVFLVKFIDGSGMTMAIAANGIDFTYYIDASKMASASHAKDEFVFNLRKNGSYGNKNMVEPYTYLWDGTVEHLISHPRYGCRKDAYNLNFCAKLIQMNGWKIPEDYPVKF